MWQKPSEFSTREDSRPGVSGVLRKIEDDRCQSVHGLAVHTFRKEDTHADVV